MAESEDSSQSFFRRHWEGYKEFWSQRFSFLDNYSRFVKRDQPLPSWSAADVEEFIASDPVHGPTRWYTHRKSITEKAINGPRKSSTLT